MNRFILSLLTLAISLPALSQANWNITDPETDFKKAKDYFIKGDYAQAYPLLKPLKDKYPENTESSHAYINQDLAYFYIVTALKLGHEVAESEARHYIETATNEPRQQLMSFHLARYYFTAQDFARAAMYYERAGYDNLSNEEIADAKFELAYSYFSMKDYGKAKPLFNEIHQLGSSKYYIDANYYFGYIAFKEGNYNQALTAFKRVESDARYADRVPYYIAQIYYFQGHKEQALEYGETALRRGTIDNQRDLNLLIGQIYFEKKQFAKALPLLEAYVNSSDKVSKEVMYELAYCYYDANQTEKAIEAFKQLSNEQDSLGQNSMYLLGDLYLKTNQKVNARNAFQYSADNNSNRFQQEISRFNYAKLSYELGYNDIALGSINQFVSQYPQSDYSNEAKEILINLLTNSNNFAEALRMYQSFEQPTPTMQRIYTRILFGRATEYINEGQYAEADDLLDQILKNPYPGNLLPYAYFWKGEIAYRRGLFEAAISNLNKYLEYGGIQGEANPKNARYSLGYAYLQTDQFARAHQSFKEVAPAITGSSSAVEQDAYVRSADALFMQKNYGTAKNMYQNVANLALPQSDYSLYQMALISGISNQSEKIKAFNQLVQRYPESDLVPEAYMQIANAYMVQERFRDAIPYLDKILTLPSASATYPAVYLKLGLIHYNLNNNAEALKNYQALVSRYPQSEEAEEALANMSEIYVEQGRPDEYVDFAKKAGKSLSVTEADSLTYTAALRQFNEGNCTAAVQSFSNYLSKYPAGSYALPALFNRSECYRQNNDIQAAVKGYSDVVAQGNSPYAEQSAFLAARIYYLDLKNYDSSKRYFEKLHALAVTQENQLEALRGLTRSYYQTNDFSKANEVSKELLTKKGINTDDKAIANLVLGKSLQLAGNCNEAIQAFKQVAVANKAAWGAEARYEIARCYYTEGRLDDAEKAGMDLIKAGGSDFWVASAYILLGDIYLKQKDYFNAKATYKSVADNAMIPELKKKAAEKYEQALAEEKASSKIQSDDQ